MIQSGDLGDKAGFVILWAGNVKVGDEFEPEVYDYLVEFDLGNDVKESRYAHLTMMTYDVDYNYNKIYFNDKYVGKLHQYKTKEWRVDTFRVPLDAIKKGKNIFKMTARNSSGGVTGNIDDYQVQDPMLIYAVQ